MIVMATPVVKAQLTLTGEVTPRTEFRNGFKKLSPTEANPAFFIEQRTRLYTNYKASNLELQITLQDVRFWGANGQVHKSDNAMFGITEGWGRYYIDSTFSVKIGRQMISYDNQRFFGGLEWAMQGRRHDAVVFMYENNGLKVHVGGAFNQNPTTGAEPVRVESTFYPSPNKGAYHATANYRDMEYVWANKTFDGGAVSLYLVNDNREYDTAKFAARQTYGVIGNKAFGPLTLNGEFFYQGGKTATLDVKALMFSLSGTVKTSITPVTIGYDYLSGNKSSTPENEAWAPLYGTNHAFYGFMDYFYVGNPHGNVGLQDIYLKTKFKVAKSLLLVHAHQFLAAVDIIDSSTGNVVSSSLGTEFDLVYVKKLKDGVVWKLGYSHMLSTDSMGLIKGGDASSLNNWAWTMISFKPALLKK